jgi:hypothetical protein
VRWLPSVRESDVGLLGNEAEWLARLADAGVAVAPAWLVPCGREGRDDGWVERLAAVLVAALTTAAEEGAAPKVRIGPWFASRAAQSRFGRDFPQLPEVVDADGATEVARALSRSLGRSLGTLDGRPGALDGVYVRVVALGAAIGASFGFAASAEPSDGDPDMVSVWTEGARPWLLDRRTMRFASRGDLPLDDDLAARVADLVDRAQLVLGRPVEVRWLAAHGRLYVASVRELGLAPRFTGAAYRRVALMAEDEGTVAPLAVDAIDKALGRDDAAADEPRVRREYARPYKRIDAPPQAGAALAASPASPLVRAGRNFARVAGDVASPLAASRRFAQELAGRVAKLDAVPLQRLSDAGLLAHVRERERLVIDALVLLDRARVATLAALPAIETAAGELPRDAYIALAAPRATRERRRAHERIERLAVKLSAAGVRPGTPAGALPAALRREWDETRRAVLDVRPLGLDITPHAYGESDATLEAALPTVSGSTARNPRFGATAVLPCEDDLREEARRAAVRRLSETARQRSFGRSREAVVRSVALVLSSLADAKGEVAEGLAIGLLRLRTAALVVGERLCDAGILEAADDALYMDVEELGQALEGEPGAYAARVRLRREDDQRWARYEAPRRLRAR